MRYILTLAALALTVPLLAIRTPAHAGSQGCENRSTTGGPFAFIQRNYTDCDTTKDNDGKDRQAATLSSVASDFRIVGYNPDTGKRERLTLWVDHAMGDTDGAGATGGGVSIHLEELTDGLYFSLGGGRSWEGEGAIVKAGITFAASPF